MDDKETTKCYIGFVEKEGIQDNHNENPNIYLFSQEKKVMSKSKPIFQIPTNLIRNEKQNDDEASTNDTKWNYEEKDNQNNGYNNSNEEITQIIIYPEEEKKENNGISNQNSSNEKNYLFKANNNIKEDNNKNKELKNLSNNISKNKNKNNRSKKGPVTEIYIRCIYKDSNISNKIICKYKEKPKYNVPIDKIEKELEIKIIKLMTSKMIISKKEMIRIYIVV